MERLKNKTLNMVSQNIEKISELFPAAITEMRDKNGNLKKGVNFEILKQLLSPDVVDGGEERYEFTWVGKKAAMAEAARPITKTLRPVKEDSRDWNTTENLYIEGDNLEVLKILQESYLGKVKMIYIDPPYNTGKDFVYPDRFQMDNEEYKEKTNYFDEEGNVNYARVNNESEDRYHSDWCSMMYSRIKLARNLLSEEGVIYISINDFELKTLLSLCDEIFGESNHLVTFVWNSKGSGAYDSEQYKTEHEYIVVYAKKSKNFMAKRNKYDTSEDKAYSLQDDRFEVAGYYKRQALAMGTLSYSESLDYPVETPDGNMIYPGGKFGPPYAWRYGKEKMKWALENDFAEFVETKNGWSLFSKQYERMDSDGNLIERDKPYSSSDLVAKNRNGTELVKN